MSHILTASWRRELRIRTDNGPLDWHGRINWTISDERVCVGTWDHGPKRCPLQSPVNHDYVCGHCAPPWSECVFEPVDHRDHCPLCDREHVVYVAMYGKLAKVGMTSASRVETRLLEQGADAWFIAQRRPNRGRARETERTISKLYGIPERRSRKEYLRHWQAAPPMDAITRRAQDLAQRMANRFDVEPVHTNPHNLPPLPGPPAPVDAPGKHVGEVLGAKGRFLIYQADRSQLEVGSTPVRALALSDLVGRYVTIGGAEPQ